MIERILRIEISICMIEMIVFQLIFFQAKMRVMKDFLMKMKMKVIISENSLLLMTREMII